MTTTTLNIGINARENQRFVILLINFQLNAFQQSRT